MVPGVAEAAADAAGAVAGPGSGTVTVPEADINLERLDEGVSTSDDVVVLDPVDPKRSTPNTLDLDLALVMGKDVNIKGFGLTGTLGGSLRVRAVPGREMRGTGALDVGGRYTAYGQRLQITCELSDLFSVCKVKTKKNDAARAQRGEHFTVLFVQFLAGYCNVNDLACTVFFAEPAQRSGEDFISEKFKLVWQIISRVTQKSTGAEERNKGERP